MERSSGIQVGMLPSISSVTILELEGHQRTVGVGTPTDHETRSNYRNDTNHLRHSPKMYLVFVWRLSSSG